MALPKDEQMAVIWHEKGHIRKFHVWKRLWKMVTGTSAEVYALCKEQEHEADLFAVDHGCGAALIRLLARLPNRSPGDWYPTPKERIDRIMKHGRPI
jgi:Zn-dependent protease with chaperone function